MAQQPFVSALRGSNLQCWITQKTLWRDEVCGSAISAEPRRGAGIRKDLWMSLLTNGVNTWETHMVFEDVISAGTLPTWTKRDRDRMKWKASKIIKAGEELTEVLSYKYSFTKRGEWLRGQAELWAQMVDPTATEDYSLVLKPHGVYWLGFLNFLGTSDYFVPFIYFLLDRSVFSSYLISATPLHFGSR